MFVVLLYKAEKWRLRNLLLLGIVSTSHAIINTLSIYGEAACPILATLLVSNLDAHTSFETMAFTMKSHEVISLSLQVRSQGRQTAH